LKEKSPPTQTLIATALQRPDIAGLRGVQRESNPHLLLHKRRSAPVNDGHHEIADNRAVEIKAPAEAAPSVVPYYQNYAGWGLEPASSPL
jgi:hypothetical protein